MDYMNYSVLDFNWEVGDDDMPVVVRAEYKLLHESNHGADADGNRGIPVDWIDDLIVTVFDAEGQDITASLPEEEMSRLYLHAEDKIGEQG